MIRNYSAVLAEQINNILNSNELNFDFNEELGIFDFDFDIKLFRKLSYKICAMENSCLVYASCALSADIDDENIRSAMTEFICRANYGLVNGNFELDVRNGEIRYKIFIPCPAEEIHEETLVTGIACCHAMFDRYARGILGVILNGMDAEDAIALCE